MSVGTKVVRRSALAAAVAAASVSLALPAFAEQAQGNVLEEVIVTGTKRDISQQDAPIAISTLTSTDIDKTFRNDIRAIGDLSPNVTLTNQTGFNALAGGIRGTGTISILTTQDPSVGLLIDEFALNHVQSQLVEMFDLEQVEVYRGPQGTLFGKNSTGGVIAITSKRPDLDQFGGQVKYNVGQYDVPGDADNQKMQVGVDIPLIQGVLGLRFAGSYTKEDGFYTNDKDTATFPNSPLYTAFGLDTTKLPEQLLRTSTTGAGEQLGGARGAGGSRRPQLRDERARLLSLAQVAQRERGHGVALDALQEADALAVDDAGGEALGDHPVEVRLRDAGPEAVPDRLLQLRGQVLAHDLPPELAVRRAPSVHRGADRVGDRAPQRRSGH